MEDGRRVRVCEDGEPRVDGVERLHPHVVRRVERGEEGQDGEEDKVEVIEGATRFIARIISSHFPETVDRANDSHFEAENKRL